MVDGVGIFVDGIGCEFVRALRKVVGDGDISMPNNTKSEKPLSLKFRFHNTQH